MNERGQWVPDRDKDGRIRRVNAGQRQGRVSTDERSLDKDRNWVSAHNGRQVGTRMGECRQRTPDGDEDR